MDLNDLRSLWTVVSFAAFLGIVFWAYSGKRKARFDEAARLALDDEAGDGGHENQRRRPSGPARSRGGRRLRGGGSGAPHPAAHW